MSELRDRLRNQGKRRRALRELNRALRFCNSLASIDGRTHRCGMPRGHTGTCLIAGRRFARVTPGRLA